MPTTHDLVQGEYLAMIALQHGFHDSRVIWDHPDNADLRTKRKNPNVLLPGDRLVIPDRTSGLVDAATGKVNPFVAGDDAPRLNVDFDDASAKALANRDGPLTLGGQDTTGTFVRAKALNTSTDGDGRLTQEFKGPFADRVAATEADFQMLAQPTAAAAEFRLLIGNLDPVDEPSGQRARLDNLGYFAGYTENDRDQLEWATEEFQCDEKLKDRGLFDDRKKNLPTWNHLGKRHGDLLPGEEVS